LSADTVVFGIAALLVIASALMVVINTHPVHSALYLVLTFLGLAVFFFQLQAPFLAFVQIIVYAGAIMVLFLFVIMLLGEDKPMASERSLGVSLPVGIAIALVLIAELGYLMVRQPEPGADVQVANVVTIGQQSVPFGSVQSLGNTLFIKYLFAFEATSIVLLIAMVGVVVLAKKRL
jgi:NADH-quinone oxidoreductase subunit J